MATRASASPERAGAAARTLRARVYYDFASTLCYVAHRVFAELEPRFGEIGVELDWCPLDLADLLGWRRGVPVDQDRLANAERVAAEFGVAVRPLPVWPDSRDALAAALALGDGPRAAAFRERLWAAAFEERRAIDAPGAVADFARDLGLALDPLDLERERNELERITREAHEQGVTGLPTLMLGAFPFPGIQSRETTWLVVERWARTARASELLT